MIDDTAGQTIKEDGRPTDRLTKYRNETQARDLEYKVGQELKLESEILQSLVGSTSNFFLQKVY